MLHILLIHWILGFFSIGFSGMNPMVAIGNTDGLTKADIPFAFPDLKPPVFPKRTFDIRQYGAVTDGKTLNTEALRKSIQACNQAGGGTVLVPTGIWITGAVHLKSNVNLHLEKGAELRFSQTFSDYLPVVLSQRGGYFCYNYSPFVYASNCENIAVTGLGTLNGQGQVWWPWSKKQPGMTQLFQMGKKETPIEQRVFGTEEAGVRPPFVQFIKCKNVFLEGITVLDGPSWNIHPVFCENVIVRKLTIKAHGPNNDGIDPDGCKNVLIEDCHIDVGDDNICLKSGRDEEAWKLGRPCENIVVRRCRTKAGHGGFVIGSEMSAGVTNVLVEDCHFAGTDRGLRFKSRIGRGGEVANVWVRNITMDTIRAEAIVFNLLYDSEPVERTMNYQKSNTQLAHAPTFRNFHLENITCKKAKQAISLIGLPGWYLRELSFNNIKIDAEKGVDCQDAKDIVFQQLAIKPQAGATFQLTDCQQVHFDKTPVDADFLRLNGLLTAGIEVRYTALISGQPAIALADELKDKDVLKLYLTSKR